MPGWARWRAQRPKLQSLKPRSTTAYPSPALHTPQPYSCLAALFTPRPWEEITVGTINNRNLDVESQTSNPSSGQSLLCFPYAWELSNLPQVPNSWQKRFLKTVVSSEAQVVKILPTLINAKSRKPSKASALNGPKSYAQVLQHQPVE